jgi:hypothetical protein
MAVGSGGSGNLALELSGGTWSVTTTPDPSGTYSNAMLDVSCPQVDNCVADWWASFFTSGNPEQKAITWNGSAWSGTDTLATGSAPEVMWLACPTTSSCVSVGLRSVRRAEKTLVKLGNGTSGWSTARSANPSNQSSLVDTSCASASFCVAVGTRISGGGDPFIESGPA